MVQNYLGAPVILILWISKSSQQKTKTKSSLFTPPPWAAPSPWLLPPPFLTFWTSAETKMPFTCGAWTLNLHITQQSRKTWSISGIYRMRQTATFLCLHVVMVEVYPEQSSATGSGTVGTDQMSSIVLKVGEQTSYFLSNLQRNWVYAKNSKVHDIGLQRYWD